MKVVFKREVIDYFLELAEILYEKIFWLLRNGKKLFK